MSNHSLSGTSGAHLLPKLLEHSRHTLDIPIENTHAWTDITIVVNWLDGSPRRLKTYIGNRVSFILDRIPPNRWKHVPGELNPADCASRGLLPLELVEHPLWWRGPNWLHATPHCWPDQVVYQSSNLPEVECELACHLTTVHVETIEPLFSLDQFSSYSKLIRVTAWILRFVKACDCSYSSLR